ncbi:MAG: MgtC/SapB family protein [Candidatus Giovannonibacteria bacterium]|nr:MgtC/SapB family protein [Candidatus Giovannonibacteria bacterium]
MLNNFLDQQTIIMIGNLSLAAVLGMAIGFEREHRRKPAGLRTYTLVALGAALFTVISIAVYHIFPSISGVSGYDYHLVANIVVGIGFIGGGLIFMRGGHMEGLTTAAGLWATAAVGMAAGFGLYAVAIYAAILVLFILWAMRSLENVIHKDDAPQI